jgi:hypothetical protein
MSQSVISAPQPSQSASQEKTSQIDTKTTRSEQVPQIFNDDTQILTQLENATRDLQSALENIPISHILRHRSVYKATNLISVHSTTPLYSVLDVLAENRILAVPVYNVPTDNPFDKEYIGEFLIKSPLHLREPSSLLPSSHHNIGIVSIFDILGYTVFQKVFQQMQYVAMFVCFRVNVLQTNYN